MTYKSIAVIGDSVANGYWDQPFEGWVARTVKKQLEAWFKKQYPDKPPVTAKTIANRFRDYFREYQKKSA